MNFWDLFTDPVFRGATWGTLLMAIPSSLMGVLLLLKRQSLIGESLSHATYPGIVLGVSLGALCFPEAGEKILLASLIGAFVSSFAGLKIIAWMETSGKVRSDAALCFVLSLFFGIGTVIASAMQWLFPSGRRQVQTLLFGQAATMSDFHSGLYAGLALVVIAFLWGWFRPIQAFLFDLDFAKGAGLPVRFLQKTFFFLLLLSLTLGIRSVGIVLMSGMIVAPAVAARQFTDRLAPLFVLSAFFGAASAFLGNFFSSLSALFGTGTTYALPTGPSIILVGSFFAVASLLLAPKRGLVFRMGRIALFRFRCLQENVLKTIWKRANVYFPIWQGSRLNCWLAFVLWRLKREGWIEGKGGRYCLTHDGYQKASAVVRLHRLWELYLASELGFQKEKIHCNAEEMEHILTPDIEERLTRLLANPTTDPHHQPIPGKPQGIG
ncbi:MAG: metal ABC transporter permease [Chlamydiia bacterium]|nr:metal ABC transporter permease [Chlamydiia bacterium]